MRSPRCSIAGLMALVGTIALDCWVIRAYASSPSSPPDLGDLIVFGALPMANLLALGLIALRELRPGPGQARPLLARFEVSGGAALLAFLICAVLFTHPIHEGVGRLALPLREVPVLGQVLFLTAAATLLGLPQLVSALAGAWLISTYRVRVSVVIERRPTAARAAVPPARSEGGDRLGLTG